MPTILHRPRPSIQPGHRAGLMAAGDGLQTAAVGCRLLLAPVQADRRRLLAVNRRPQAVNNRSARSNTGAGSNNTGRSSTGMARTHTGTRKRNCHGILLRHGVPSYHGRREIRHPRHETHRRRRGIRRLRHEIHRRR